MKYLISDIHGDKKGFLKLLKKIDFDKDKDCLYILGDIFDRNVYGYDIYKYIRPYVEQGSMVMIKGNHEHYAQRFLQGDLDENLWSELGDPETVRRVKALPDEEKRELETFILDLPHYVEIETKYGKTLLIHSSIGEEKNYVFYTDDDGNEKIDIKKSIDKSIEDDEVHYLQGYGMGDLPVSELRMMDRYVICGHYPTCNIRDDGKNLPYISKYYMDIDCGHSKWGGEYGPICCYCVDSDSFIFIYG